MSKALKITFIVIASILVLLALGLGLGLGLRQNEQPETEVLTLNVDGDNVKRIQLEPGDNVYSYITENYPEYTDYNTCGWFIEDTLTMPLTEDITIAEDENITIYTRTATLDKLSFTLNDDETTYSVSASSEDISGEVVVPRMYSNESTSGLVTEVADNGFSKDSESPYRNNLTLAVLPNSIETIGTQAFYNNFSMAFINIPYGVTTIGDEAYRSCYSVNSITIPSTVESIGTNSFRIAGLAEVYNYSTFDIELGSTDNGYAGYYTKVVYNASDLVNDKPESRVKTIGNVSYYVYGDDFIALAPTESRATLKEVVLDERTTEINNFAFNYCTALESINIPENVKVIGQTAFQYCENLSSPIVIPEGVTEIGTYTFFKCRKLPSIIIPSTVTSIGRNAFTYCENITYINIPGSVQTIEQSTFNGCGSLMNVTLNDGLQSIGQNAFASCLSLKSITIPNTVTTIDNNAFNSTPIVEVYNFSDLVIEQNLTTNGRLGQYALTIYNADDLQDVVHESKIDVIDGIQYYIDGDDFIALAPATTNKPRSYVSSVVLDERTTSIYREAFHNCYSLMNLVLNDGLESIGENAFTSCYSLKSVTIPQTVTSLEDNSFGGGNSIIEVYNYSNLIIEQGEVGIGERALAVYNASDLQDDKPESKIQVIGDVQYYVDGEDFIAVGTATTDDRSRPEITDIVLDERTTEIYLYAFHYYQTLESIVIPEGVKTIKSYSIDQCEDLTSIVIPSTVTTIEDNAFMFNDTLTNVTINSVYAYTTATSESACGRLLENAYTVKVLASIVDNPENTNTWLNGSAWTKSESADEDGYYTYTRVVEA